MTEQEAIECAMDFAELTYWREFHAMDGRFKFHMENVAKIRKAAEEKMLTKIASMSEEAP